MNPIMDLIEDEETSYPTPRISDICECITRTLKGDSRHRIHVDLGISAHTQNQIREALKEGGVKI
jgi:hypothetical protein